MAQQTAIEWLLEQIQKTFSEYIKLNPDWEVIEQAKAMEKEQIINTYLDGIMHPLDMEATKQAEQYYNETYGK